MLDRNTIRENLDSVHERLKDKGFELDREAFLKLDQAERSGRQEGAEVGEANKQGEEIKGEMDDLLDEIDSVLEENAEEFVRNYVQKGGQ